ncbi:MAG: N-formylglutamate amidohydrolase [Calditrichaeota bacterium]|nr:N-formylglutamate amidohydrolase [Calditrichota bacterium]
MKTTTLLFTSEHGGNQIPEKYKHLFKGHENVLKTHRGYDLGIWSMAEAFSNGLQARLFKINISRLLVDVNRSLWRRTLFSEMTKPLSKSEKKNILDSYYYPHREKISTFLNDQISSGQKVLHIATHSFTPVMNGVERNADIGFLYNPERSNEKLISKEWKKTLNMCSDLRVRFNYPYRGKPDGLTAHFRKKYSNGSYLGVELEVNQKFVNEEGRFPDDLCKMLVSTFTTTISHFNWL